MNSKFISSTAKFFAEIGTLKRFSCSGWKLAGIKEEDFIGLHVVRAAQIAYILAHLEGVNPEKTACIVLFHDNGEIRVGDQNKVAARYFDISQAEKKAYLEQIANLPSITQQKLKQYFLEFEKRNTKEGIVAQDADWLETAISAKEYLEKGAPKSIQNWIDNVKKALETSSAKKILEIIEKQEDFTDSWWQGLKKMTYQKLY